MTNDKWAEVREAVKKEFGVESGPGHFREIERLASKASVMRIEMMEHEHHCERCGHTWQTLLKNPKACQKCKTRDWSTPATGKRGRPRTLPDELREDLTAYNREYARKRRARKANP